MGVAVVLVLGFFRLCFIPILLLMEFPFHQSIGYQKVIARLLQEKTLRNDRFYFHYSDLVQLPAGLEIPQPAYGGVGIIFTT